MIAILAFVLYAFVTPPDVGLAARGATPSAFERRCIPSGGVARPSNIPDILGPRALPAGRLAVLGATMDLRHGLQGECVVFAPLDGAATVVGGEECSRRTLPASTFKVPHALIGLQTGVITAETVYKWDGQKRDYPVWERDQTVDSAIKNSVVWFFQRMASAIGRQRELDELRAFNYGSAAFKGDVTQFWLNGDLTITPIEQVAFLQKMFSYELPVDRRHIDIVKAALTMPRGTLSNAAGIHDFPLRWPDDTIVRAKTGNGNVDGHRVSWLVGSLETGGRQYVFASRARSATALENTAGADLAVRVLNAMRP